MSLIASSVYTDSLTLASSQTGQSANQTSAPLDAGPSQSAMSTHSTATAHEKTDAIQSLGANAASDVPAKNQIAQVTTLDGADPLGLSQHKRANVTQRQMELDYPQANKRLESGDEERLAALDTLENGPKVKFAVNASFVVNFFLFVIQLYAAISTGSLSLFATAADAFMDLVSSVVMLITSRMAARPSVYKYPVGRTRIETIGIIMFCCLMTTVAIQLIVRYSWHAAF